MTSNTGICSNAVKENGNFCLSNDGDELLIWETQTVNLVDPRMFLLVGVGQSLLTSRDRPQITELLSGCSPVGRSWEVRECFRGLEEFGVHVIGSA